MTRSIPYAVAFAASVLIALAFIRMAHGQSAPMPLVDPPVMRHAAEVMMSKSLVVVNPPQPAHWLSFTYPWNWWGYWSTNFIVQQSPNPNGPWTTIANIIGTQTTNTYVVPIDATESQAFYRYAALP